MSNAPKVTFQQWLMAQGHRDDSVGTLVRLWLQEPGTDLGNWIEERRQGLILAGHISQAESEYLEAIEDLANGQSSPTFTRMIARLDTEGFMEERLDFHNKTPDVSADEYLHRKHVELWKMVESRTIIYIDTCHWVKLRHVALNDPKQDPVYARILALLNQLTKEQLIVCPVSFPLFEELMRQSDPHTREVTARLMDQFSNGVCLQYPDDLTRTEIRQVMVGPVLGEKAKEMAAWVWTKAGCLGGEKLPTHDALYERSNRLIQKCCIDTQWAMCLTDFLDCIRHDNFPQQDYVLAAGAYNLDAKWYRDNKLSFAKILEQEKAFLIRQSMAQFEEYSREVVNRYPNECAEYMKRGAVQQGPDPFMLPSIQIRAGIHASYFSSPQTFKPNDLVDAEHAALALPYCEMFFCDGPLAHRLTCKPLAFDKAYSTKVISSPEVFALELASLVDAAAKLDSD